MLALLLLSGCPRRKAAQSLATAEIVRVESVTAGPAGLTGRVQVRWPGQKGRICLERLDWSVAGEPSLFLEAEADGPCEAPDGDQDPSQWLFVRSTAAALAALARGGGDEAGEARVVARVRGMKLVLEGRSGPGLRLGDGCVIELGDTTGASRARLEVTGFPPRALVHLRVDNPLPADLDTDGGQWRFLRGGRLWAVGDLEAPARLPAGEAFELSMELGADKALALGTATVVGAGEFRLEAELGLRTPWGRVVVVSSFEL